MASSSMVLIASSSRSSLAMFVQLPVAAYMMRAISREPQAMQALLEAGTEDARVVMRTRALRQFTIGVQRHRLVLRVDIEDNGPGISQELQETIFYPMVSGRANGSGLGLSIAQSIISQHQGLIECDSEPGRTCFSLLLPMEPVDTTESKGS